MKILIQVESKAQVPAKYADSLVVVDVTRPAETLHFLQGKESDVILFFPAGTPVGLFVKLIEDYPGNLAVYSVVEVGEVMRSRFTTLINRVPITINKAFGAVRGLEAVLNHVKEVMA